MRTAARLTLSSSRRAATRVILLLIVMGACSSTRLTPQQEWVMSKFAECKTLTNALNVTLPSA